MTKGVMGQAQVTLVQWKYLKFFSLKRCSKGRKQQSKTSLDNPKICLSVTIKDFNKGARKTPRRTHCNEQLFSVTKEEKAPVFNSAERKTSGHWSQLFFFFFFETISTFGSKIFPCSKECHNPIMFCTGKKSLSSIYLKSGICYLFLAVLNFLYCETAIKNKVEEKSCNIRQINQNHLKLSFEAFSILTCKELLHTFTQTRSCCC